MPAFSRFLRYFLVVGRIGSIRKASEELNISASAIDRQILLGEEQLGVALFERLPGGMRLTTAGEMLTDAAKRWHKEFGAIQVALDDLRGLRRGHVRFAVIDALAKGFVPAMIQRLQDEHPGITLDIVVLENLRVAAAIAHGDVDFGIMLMPRPAKELRVRAHVPIALGIVSPTDHPVCQRQSAPFSVCAQYPVVAPGEPLALSEHLRSLQAASGVAMQTVATSDNIQMIKSLVANGVGISVLSWIDVAEEVERGELAFTPIAGAAIPPLTLALCIDPARQLSGACRLILGRLETALSSINWPTTALEARSAGGRVRPE
jgi:DNA-binding transcriptional LysR family regulator